MMLHGKYVGDCEYCGGAMLEQVGSVMHMGDTKACEAFQRIIALEEQVDNLEEYLYRRITELEEKLDER
jgi:hypothetical protein